VENKIKPPGSIHFIPSSMEDSDDEEYFWYSDSELEEEEILNDDGGQPSNWTQSIYTESSTRQKVPAGYEDEFNQFANWRYGMPQPCPVSKVPLTPSSARPNFPPTIERNYAELRKRKFLCLHYFSNMLGFSFDDKNEDVYPLDSIKEWNDIKEFTTWGDMLKEHIENGKE